MVDLVALFLFLLSRRRLIKLGSGQPDFVIQRITIPFFFFCSLLCEFLFLTLFDSFIFCSFNIYSILFLIQLKLLAMYLFLKEIINVFK